jgi:hypothetical protein
VSGKSFHDTGLRAFGNTRDNRARQTAFFEDVSGHSYFWRQEAEATSQSSRVYCRGY